MTTLVNALEQRGGRYALQTMCEGGGMIKPAPAYCGDIPSAERATAYYAQQQLPVAGRILKMASLRTDLRGSTNWPAPLGLGESKEADSWTQRRRTRRHRPMPTTPSR
jgi:hypothetical protein